MKTDDRMEEKKRILITGASGFIGGFIVDEALRRGYDVWAGIRSRSSRAHLQDSRIHFINLQYDNKESLVNQLREVVSTIGAWHYVVHNAGITKTLKTNEFYNVNSLNTYIFTEALAEADCCPQKFILMSSLSSYGPVNESSFRPIRLDDEQQPTSIYGKSKLEAELFVQSQKHFPYVILRPTGVYGPGDKDYLVELKSIKSGFDFKVGMKPQQLTFIYVKDLAESIFLAIENEKVKDCSYFISDGDVYTDTEFAKLVQKLLSKNFVFHLRIPMWISYIACVLSEFVGNITGKVMTLNTDKYNILKQRNWICDIEPARLELGFLPKYNLKEGLVETICYDKEHGLL